MNGWVHEPQASTFSLSFNIYALCPCPLLHLHVAFESCLCCAYSKLSHLLWPCSGQGGSWEMRPWSSRIWRGPRPREEQLGAAAWLSFCLLLCCASSCWVNWLAGKMAGHQRAELITWERRPVRREVIIINSMCNVASWLFVQGMRRNGIGSIPGIRRCCQASTS